MASRTAPPVSRPIVLWLWRASAACALLFLVVLGTWSVNRPLPVGMHVAGPKVAVDPQNLRLLVDQTAADAFGQPVVRQQIFEATLALIADAHRLLVLDYFLFNTQHGPASASDRRLRPISAQLRDALLRKHAADPQLAILVIVDPINGDYGNTLPPDLLALRRSGIDVVVVDLDALRDSNPLYSTPWRALVNWWLHPKAEGSWPNPLDVSGPRLSAGAFFRLLNFKADHRKVALSYTAQGVLHGIVSSANPHDASSAHSNIGLEAQGPALRSLLESELAIARNAGWAGMVTDPATGALDALPADTSSDTWLQALTDGAIRDALLERMASCGSSDEIDIAMFYLTDRTIIRALLAAARRGARVRVLLDPNREAFGYERSGLPNRQVAAELVSASDAAIRVRWYRTHGEQFHVKFVSVRQGSRLWFTLGSANLTRRNLGDYNLEANMAVGTTADTPIARGVSGWFDTLWNNRVGGGIEYSADVDLYADSSQFRYWLYRLMEATGLSTF